MGLRRLIGALIGLLATAGALAGCGTATKSTPTVLRPAATVASRPDPAGHAHIAFLTPATDATVSATVTVRVKVTGKGWLRFTLDGRHPRLAARSTIIYRHLSAGRHRLEAQLLASREPAAKAIATAIVRFNVRSAPLAAKPSVSVSPPAPSPTATASTPAPRTSTSTPALPPPVAPPVTTPSPPPSPSAAQRAPPATHQPAGGGIPQGGGGDHDGDNSGGPSDGDGNV